MFAYSETIQYPGAVNIVSESLRPSLSACLKQEEEKPAIYAKLDDIKRTFHAQSLSVYQEYYWRGSQGTKSTDREKLIRKAAELKNITSRLLAFLFALCRQGFDGTLCPLDVISERLKKSTGGKGEPRTIRRALITLEQLGWIHRAYHRTGSQVMTHKGLLNLQVLRVTFCPSIYQALGFVSIPTEHRPKRPLHPNTKSRQEKTIVRFSPADDLTIGLSEAQEKGDRLDGVRLAPSIAVAHTSVPLLQIAANEQEAQKPGQPIAQTVSAKLPERRLKMVINTVDLMISQAVNDPEIELNKLYAEEYPDPIKAIPEPPPEKYKQRPFSHKPPENERAALGQLRHFLIDFYKDIESHCYAKGLFKVVESMVDDPKDPTGKNRIKQIDTIMPALVMAQNQHSTVYPSKFPRVDFDLMEYTIAEPIHKPKMISDYVSKLLIFEKDPATFKKIKMLFMKREKPQPLNYSFSPQVAGLCTIGRMKIADLRGEYLVDFNV